MTDWGLINLPPLITQPYPLSQTKEECHFPTIKQHLFKRTFQITPFHLTRLFELRKSCWELCDSQRVWKSQFSDVFVRVFLVFAKQHVVCDKTTRCSWDFKGLFSYYVPRNLFFFPRDFENVRRNSISDGQNRGNVGEIPGKIGENQEKIGEIRRILHCFKIRGQERRKVSVLITVDFFLEGEKTWPFWGFRFNISISDI